MHIDVHDYGNGLSGELETVALIRYTQGSLGVRGKSIKHHALGNEIMNGKDTFHIIPTRVKNHCSFK